MKSRIVVIGNYLTKVKSIINEARKAEIDYIKIVNENMEEISIINKGDILALAVYIGTTRLIDNYIIGEEL